MQADGGAIPAGMTRDDVWNAKYIYDSAYHPTTGELVFMPGRMSFQGNFINNYFAMEIIDNGYFVSKVLTFKC